MSDREGEIAWLRRREQRERAMAAEARCHRSRSAHDYLARVYRQRRAALIRTDANSAA